MRLVGPGFSKTWVRRNSGPGCFRISLMGINTKVNRRESQLFRVLFFAGYSIRRGPSNGQLRHEPAMPRPRRLGLSPYVNYSSHEPMEIANRITQQGDRVTLSLTSWGPGLLAG